MFATKGRLKVPLLVVGVLIVGLGIYAAFQVKDAAASAAGCNANAASSHRDTEKVRSESYSFVRETTIPATCPFCGSSGVRYRIQFKMYETIRWTTQHYISLGNIGWTHCHNHRKGPHFLGFYIYYTNAVDCSNSDCGG